MADEHEDLMPTPWYHSLDDLALAVLFAAVAYGIGTAIQYFPLTGAVGWGLAMVELVCVILMLRHAIPVIRNGGLSND